MNCRRGIRLERTPPSIPTTPSSTRKRSKREQRAKKNRLLLSPRCCTKKKSTRVPFFTTFNAFLVNFPSANGEAIAHTGLSLVSSSSSPGVDGTGNPSRPRFFDEPPPPLSGLSPRFSFFAFFALFSPLDPILLLLLCVFARMRRCLLWGKFN